MTSLLCVSTIAGVLYCCRKRWLGSNQEPPATNIFRLRRQENVPPLRPWLQRTQRRQTPVVLFEDETFKNPLADISSSDDEYQESMEMGVVV